MTENERKACELIVEIADDIVASCLRSDIDTGTVWAWDEHAFGEGPEHFLNVVQQIGALLAPTPPAPPTIRERVRTRTTTPPAPARS